MYGGMFRSFFIMKSFGIKQKNLPSYTQEIYNGWRRIRTALVLDKKISRAILGRPIVDGEGFEPSKASPADLQSVPFGHSGIHP